MSLLMKRGLILVKSSAKVPALLKLPVREHIPGAKLTVSGRKVIAD
jgi:hypothetical protein